MPNATKKVTQLKSELETARQRIAALEALDAERMRTEQALRVRDELMLLFVQYAPAAIAMFDRNMRYLSVSHRWLEDFGLAGQDVLGRDHYQVFPNVPERWKEIHRRCLAGAVERSEEDVFEWPDGSRQWLKWEVRPWSEASGAIGGIIIFCEDITARKKAELALKESEERYRILFESSHAIKLLVDPDTGEIVDANPAACAYYGYTLEEMRKINVERVCILPHEELLAKMVQAQDPTQNRFESRHRLASGEVRDVEIASDTVFLKGKKLLYAIIQDISERKHMQEVMIQTEKMMSIGGLAAGMAHEINNPLSAIIQSVQVVQSRLTKDSPTNLAAAAVAGCPFENIRAFLERREVFTLLQGVRDASSRAARIVSSMLEFSRKSESVRAPTDINALLDKAVELCANDYDLKKKYDFRNIVITRDFDASMPPVPCTATQIEQVVVNLLRNSAQAMSGNTERGDRPEIHLKTAHEEGMARIEVRDNGPGMDEASKKRLFEPFFTTKGPGEGTGLGLSVSYFIIAENHKGTIDVDSAPGKGSTFTIRLPLA
ncbi:PAS domain-containing sensor histidine kinase [Fundidesulfovibrio terrae]|uniref:PAS domain-containing sensor histidine kinase n=1 Tax=Fundidesulfovibrio terrae TaxID=2922866 RepID=UPI001FAFDDFA|nr:PAS domain S-box protein [Fundidesulfovibrio terrae]